EPTFKEVVVLYRASGQGRKAGSKVAVRARSTSERLKDILARRNIHIKAFHDIPMADLETIMPDKKVYLKMMSIISLVVQALAAFVAAITTLGYVVSHLVTCGHTSGLSCGVTHFVAHAAAAGFCCCAQEPTFKEVVVLYRASGQGRKAGSKVAVRSRSTSERLKDILARRNIHIKAFHDIPMADLETIMPDKKVYLKMMSIISLVVQALAAFVAAITTLWT
ncbi:predicted protein, partial [Haematococcus lacustris]